LNQLVTSAISEISVLVQRSLKSDQAFPSKHYAHAMVFGSLVALVSVSALADHNSPRGTGWANMPNDIQDTRIEEGLSSTEFSACVRQGAGADTVNRYLDSSTPTRPGGGSTFSRRDNRR